MAAAPTPNSTPRTFDNFTFKHEALALKDLVTNDIYSNSNVTIRVDKLHRNYRVTAATLAEAAAVCAVNTTVTSIYQ